MKTKTSIPLTVIFLVLFTLSACSLPQVRTATSPAPERPTATQPPARPTAAPTETSAPTPTLPPLPTPTWAPGCPPANLVVKNLPDNFTIQDLIGASYFDIPAGITMKSGWLIDYNDMNDPDVWGLEEINYQGADYILFERIVCNEPGGKAYYLVLDVMPIPAMNPDETFGINAACTLNGIHEEKILAVAQVPDDLTSRPFNELGYELGPVRLAWLANIETGRFEPISIEGIRCFMAVMGP